MYTKKSNNIMISSLFFDKDNIPDIKTYFPKNSVTQ